jgi:glucan 1,3-beta-glucosidase
MLVTAIATAVALLSRSVHAGCRASNTLSSPNPAATTAFAVPRIRGINLGSWFILEKWENKEMFTGAFAGAVDQWTFDQVPGAQAAMQQHWSTWYTEADIASYAAAGFNG